MANIDNPNIKNIKKVPWLEKLSYKLTFWIGTPQSIIIHSFLFVGIFALQFFGFRFDQILLLLTTAVSLEAIYLAIFIQMTVNRHTQSLEEVEEDIEDLQEDVQEISGDLDDIQEEDKKDDAEDKKTKVALESIEEDLDKLLSDIATLKKNLASSDTDKKFLNG